MTNPLKRRIKQSIERRGLYVESNKARDDFGTMYQHAVEALLRARLRAVGPDFFFIQIGANDGVSFDWLHGFVSAHRLQGLVVEPLTDLFDELCRNYSSQPQVTPVNVAIHRTAREIDIHRVDPKAQGLPSWTKGIASVDPDHHKKSGTASEHMISETVSCVTLQELFERHGVDHIDYLQIDTEGYDLEILRMLDFDRVKPHVLKFEHQLPTGVMSREEFKQCFEILNDVGYYLLMDECDAVAYLA